MSPAELAMLHADAVVKSDEPEFGDGDDGGIEYGRHLCEECLGDKFRLVAHLGEPMVVCAGCSQPQAYAAWHAMED